MAASSQANKQTQTWVLRVPVDCEGCRKKVTKILHSIAGVEWCDVDIKQQRVVVTGNNVEAGTLINKLVKKTGKHAELWPEPKIPTEKKNKKKTKKPREKPEPEPDDTHSDHEESRSEETEPTVKQEHKTQLSTKTEAGHETTKDGGKGDEEKKAADGLTSPGHLPPSVEDRTGESQASEEKKKKSEGRSENEKILQAEIPPASDDGNPLQSNQMPPRLPIPSQSTRGSVRPTIQVRHNPAPEGQRMPTRPLVNNYSESPPLNAAPPPPRQYYHHDHHQPAPAGCYQQPQTQPIYTMNYSTARQPRTTYYAMAQPPSRSHPHASHGPNYVAPPPRPSYYNAYEQPADYDAYTFAYHHQPDSFGLFSDENPNACLIM